MYLMIQNKGVAPEGAYTILGASGNRDADNTIGQFGTGNKHAINCCLREGLEVRVYCGADRLSFGYTEEKFEDKIVHRITLTKNGKKPVERDWTLDWGSLDWTDIGMGLREFISNAIDRSERNGGVQEAFDTGDLVVTLTEKIQAKSGYTRVYIEVNDEVLSYVAELKQRFLHFSGSPKGTILLKANRGMGTDRAMIYREGVYVRRAGLQSLFDYNFSASELELDDCRNSSGYTVMLRVGHTLRDAPVDKLIMVLESLSRGEKTLEGSLDSTCLSPTWTDPTDAQKETWQTAWKACFGDAILTEGNEMIDGFVKRKGHTTKAITQEGWRTALAYFGVKTHREVLSDNERQGRVTVASTEAAEKAVDQVWEWVKAAGMDFGMARPPVKCFTNIMDAGCTTFGYYDGGTVYLNQTIADECNKMTLKVALEEVAHYVTGAEDNSRDFQDFAFGFAVEFLA
jgi:hypothetical protein